MFRLKFSLAKRFDREKYSHAEKLFSLLSKEGVQVVSTVPVLWPHRRAGGNNDVGDTHRDGDADGGDVDGEESCNSRA